MEISMKKMLFAILILLAISKITLVAQNNSAISLVPENAVAVLRVNWSEVRQNEQLKVIIKGQNFPKMTKQLGINEALVSEWSVFSDINPTSSNGLGMIISGDFTMQSIVQNAVSKNWQRQKIGANTIYYNPLDKSFMLPIRNGLVATGTKKGIDDLSNLLSNRSLEMIKQEPFSTMWNELNSNDSPISFMVGIPQKYQKIADIGYKIATKLMSLSSFGLLGTVFDKIGLVRCFGLSINHQQDVFPTKISAIMENKTTAWLASGAVNLLKKAPNAIGYQEKTEDDKQMLRSMQTINATYKGALLAVKFEMPVKTLFSK